MNAPVRYQSKRYALQSLLLAAALSVLTLGVAYFIKDGIRLVAVPTAVSFGFVTLSSTVIAVLWRKVSEGNKEMLTTFYSAVPGFRMLAALATLTVCFFCVGRDAMVPYVIVFMAFYLAALTHHSLYFSRITNNN